MEQSGGDKADTGRRYRAYPMPEQARRLTGWGHSCRAVWNLALAQRDHLYRHRGTTLRANAQCVQLTQARSDLPWLADLPAQSAQQVLRQLDRAYDNWWNPEHPAGPPRFKKRSDRLVVPFPAQAVTVQKLNTRGEQRRLLGLERRKARQVRWAKRHNGGRFSRRLRCTISEIAVLRVRQARRRLDFTHKLTTDLARATAGSE